MTGGAQSRLLWSTGSYVTAETYMTKGPQVMHGGMWRCRWPIVVGQLMQHLINKLGILISKVAITNFFRKTWDTSSFNLVSRSKACFANKVDPSADTARLSADKPFR